MTDLVDELANAIVRWVSQAFSDPKLLGESHSSGAAVQRAAAVIDGFGGELAEHSHMLANALADAGIIPRGEAEVTVEYGNEYVTGVITPSGPKEYAEWVAERGYTLYRRAVTLGPWTEVDQ